MSSTWPEKFKYHPNSENLSDQQELDLLYKYSEFDYYPVQADLAFNELASKIERKSRLDMRFLWKIAAILILTGGITFTVFQVSDFGSESVLTEISTLENGKIYRLPDGSLVTLSENSTLAFNEAEFNANRNVSFQGEGFFEIIKNNSTFTITTSGAEVSVLGTSFNLETKNDINLFVQTGLVSIKTAKGKKQVTPGQLALATKDGEITVRKNTDPNVLSWKTGVFTFDNMRIKEAIPYLEKYYEVNFKLGQELSSCTITARFEKRTLEEVVDVLSTILSAKSQIIGNQIKFTGTGCK